MKNAPTSPGVLFGMGVRVARYSDVGVIVGGGVKVGCAALVKALAVFTVLALDCSVAMIDSSEITVEVAEG